MSDDVLRTIDGALSDWETSPDAMRWSPEPEKAVDERRHPVLWGLPWLRTAERAQQAFQDLEDAMMRLVAVACHEPDWKAFRKAYLPPEPTASADRTRSPRWRAGSRRTKRLARHS